MLNNKEKTFQCSYEGCDKSYSTKGNLKNHINSFHLNIKNFKCNECDYKCDRPADLKRHIDTVHLNIKKFECNECEYKCYRKIKLKRHINNVHLKIKNFECNECNLYFTDNSKLKRHINTVHLKIKNFNCNKCDYKCYSNTEYKNHLNICTGKENISSGEYKCRECLKDLNIEYKYNTTYKVKHKKYLRWDFILYKNNEVIGFIEYDGKQHFEPSFTRRKKYTEKERQELFEITKLRDNIKNEFCLNNKYPLLRIPYTQYNNIKELINEFVNNNI